MPKVNVKLHARKDVKKASKRHIADSGSDNNSVKSNKTKSKDDSGSGSRKGKNKSGTNTNNKMKRTHLVVGTLTRSKEALDSLAQHKT